MTKPKKPVLGWFTYLYDPANAIDPQGTESSWKRQDPDLNNTNANCKICRRQPGGDLEKAEKS